MKPIIYQVFTRLYGNSVTTNKAWGGMDENGVGKMADFTAAQLNRIAASGYTHIWYTGLLEHATQTDYSAFGIAPDHPAVVKGKAGSPYAIKDYYDIDPDLAVNVKRRRQEFDALVKRTHAAGLKLVMDFVPNHVARTYHSDAKPRGVRDLGADDNLQHAFDPQNNFYYLPGQTLCTDFDTRREAQSPYREYPAKVTGNDCFTNAPGVNDWYETVKLNYGVDVCSGRTGHFDPVPSTWEKMTAILLHWAGKGVDAFRCDMAEMVPAEFWAYAIGRVKEAYPALQFIAEIYNPGAYRTYIASGFDYLYDKVGLYDTLRAVACGHASASCITGAWQAVDDIADHMLNFLENHDEQRIASSAFCGCAEKGRPALVVSALLNRCPFMVYAGQEIGEAACEAEGFSGADGRTTIFDYWGVASLQKLHALREEEGAAAVKGRAAAKKAVAKDLFSAVTALTAEERALYDYYTRVLRLCNEEKAVSEGACYDLQYANYHRDFNYNCERQFAFMRRGEHETLLVVANFDESASRAGVVIPSHAFDFLKIREGMQSAIDLLTGETMTFELRRDAPVYVNLPANGAVVLKF